MAGLLVLLLYLIAVHYGVWTGEWRPAMVLLLALPLMAALEAGRRGYLPAAALWSTIAVLIAVGQYRGLGEYLVHLPPLAIPAGLAVAFAVSLGPGQTPLVTRIATRMDGDLGERERRYTRGATLAWAAFLGLMAVATLALSLFAPPAIWSLFANFLNYLLIGAFMLAELLLRGHLLPGRREGVLPFLRRMGRLDRQRVLRGD
ncbi:MAG: ketosynthase [Thiohalospira sp.]